MVKSSQMSAQAAEWNSSSYCAYFSLRANVMLCWGWSKIALLTACSLIPPFRVSQLFLELCCHEASVKWSDSLGQSHGCFLGESTFQASAFQLPWPRWEGNWDCVTTAHLWAHFLSLGHLCPIFFKFTGLHFYFGVIWDRYPSCGTGVAPSVLVFQVVLGAGVGGELPELALVMRPEIEMSY